MLDFAVIEVTDQCNLRCKHCYDIFTGHNKLSEEEQNVIIENLEHVKCKRVTLSGGEPLIIGEDLFRFAKRISDKGIKLVMVTNGTLISNFAQSNYQIFDHIQISLDGPKEVHEQIRGKDTFDKVINAVNYLKEGNVSVSLQITINSFNQYLFNKTLEIADDLDVRLSVERVSHTGRAKEIEEIDYENYQKILTKVMKEKLLTTDPLLNATICKKYSIVPDIDTLKGCSAGRGGICISCKLDIYPCVRMRISCGNLRENSLYNILEDSLYNQLGDRSKLKGKCSSCQYKYICGGCRADAWLGTGDYFAEDSSCLI